MDNIDNIAVNCNRNSYFSYLHNNMCKKKSKTIPGVIIQPAVNYNQPPVNAYQPPVHQSEPQQMQHVQPS